MLNYAIEKVALFENRKYLDKSNWVKILFDYKNFLDFLVFLMGQGQR